MLRDPGGGWVLLEKLKTEDAPTAMDARQRAFQLRLPGDNAACVVHGWRARLPLGSRISGRALSTDDAHGARFKGWREASQTSHWTTVRVPSPAQEDGVLGCVSGCGKKGQ